MRRARTLLRYICTHELSARLSIRKCKFMVVSLTCVFEFECDFDMKLSDLPCSMAFVKSLTVQVQACSEEKVSSVGERCRSQETVYVYQYQLPTIDGLAGKGNRSYSLTSSAWEDAIADLLLCFLTLSEYNAARHDKLRQEAKYRMTRAELSPGHRSRSGPSWHKTF